MKPFDFSREIHFFLEMNYKYVYIMQIFAKMTLNNINIAFSFMRKECKNMLLISIQNESLTLEYEMLMK